MPGAQDPKEMEKYQRKVKGLKMEAATKKLIIGAVVLYALTKIK